jgi:hypothetical protein
MERCMSRARVAIVTAAVSLLAAAGSQAGINFAGVETTSVSPKPEHMLSGDLNNDGLQDIVVVSPNSKELNVFLGDNGTPSRFAPARVYRFGDHMQRAAIGDLNRDNRLDVVVADQAAKVVWILLGRGDGTFLIPYQNAVPNARNPHGVAIADFDGTGGPELAISDNRLGKVFVLRNDNQNEPRFTRLVDLNPGEEPEDIFAVDINDDGHPDLITLNQGGPRVKEVAMMVWRRAELGTPDFGEPQKFVVGEKPSAMLWADFNNDGNVDCAMLNRPTGVGNSEIDVLVSQGNGVLLPPVNVPVPCPFFTGGAPCRSIALVAADFDQNGNIDVAVTLADPRRSRGSASSLADAMQVFSGRGDGLFVPGGVFSVQKAPVSAAAADVTGDGKLDVVVANQRTLSVQAFINVSTPAEKAIGEECLMGDECISSRCTNGVCCASQCDLDLNEVCNVPGREGICTPIVAPIDCEFDEDCDSGFCADFFCCDDTCLGGRCDMPGFEGLCIPGACDGCECNGDDRECASGFCSEQFVCCKEACEGGFCDELGNCSAKKDLAELCDVDEECESNVCDVFDGICCNRKCDEIDEFCNEEGRCEPFPGVTPNTPAPNTATPTPTMTHRATPAATGELCSVPSDCANQFCVNGVCCQVQACDVDQHCAEGSGMCVDGPPPSPGTATPTRTPVPTTSGTTNCGGRCPPNQCVNNSCIVSSTSSGCSTSSDAPAGGNLAVAALLPFGLWLGRRWQLRRAEARARSRRA